MLSHCSSILYSMYCVFVCFIRLFVLHVWYNSGTNNGDNDINCSFCNSEGGYQYHGDIVVAAFKLMYSTRLLVIYL